MYEEDISVPPANLAGSLFIPAFANAIIVFVHGSGSNRFSSRNIYISRSFNKRGYATLLVDLLTETEKQLDRNTKHLRFDIDLLSKRLVLIVKWIATNPLTRDLQIGYFSASTGTAAALNSLACLNNIKAIVSRGGRTDLCQLDVLKKINIPLLLIVGSKDNNVISISKRTIRDFSNSAIVNLCLIPGATHFFEEPGKMDIVARLSLSWFDDHLLHSDNKFVNEYKANWLHTITNLRPRLHIKFRNRIAAGHLLSKMLSEYKKATDLLIVGIPRGGIVIADVLAEKFTNADFGLILSKRLRDPNNSESAIGTILFDDSVFISPNANNISNEYLKMELTTQKRNLLNQITLFHLEEYKLNCQDKRVILVDDGADTGSTLIAASRFIKSQHPKELIVALPVVPKRLVPILKEEGMKVIYVQAPRYFRSVENYYEDFSQLEDSDVLTIFNKRLKFHINNL